MMGPAVLWTVVPPLFYPATLHQEHLSRESQDLEAKRSQRHVLESYLSSKKACFTKNLFDNWASHPDKSDWGQDYCEVVFTNTDGQLMAVNGRWPASSVVVEAI